MKDGEGIEKIWKDRKRILGMPISFTKYSMSNDRMFVEKGLISVDFEEILLYRIRDISMKITLWQRIFGVGTINLTTSDKSAPTLEIKNIKNPRNTKELIHRQIEAAKKANRIRVGEILEDNNDGCDCCGDDNDSNVVM